MNNKQIKSESKEEKEERMKRYERRRDLLLVLEILGTGALLLALYYILVSVLIFFG